ncbi:NAD(P)-binding protein [Streptomyces sp. NPDC127097]|uniref:NAD(P)-binding protein n=1 Tax=Streptomyces sp. NPDC127097 TaxID=3347136 RepID=UPI00365E9BC1
MTRTSHTAAVVGGGIGGLATALLLRGSGRPVEVFERAGRLPAAGPGDAAHGPRPVAARPAERRDEDRGDGGRRAGLRG